MRKSLGLGHITALAMASAAIFVGKLPQFGSVAPRAPRRDPPQVVRLNRSQHWAHASSYTEARLKSPYPWRAVR